MKIKGTRNYRQLAVWEESDHSRLLIVPPQHSVKVTHSTLFTAILVQDHKAFSSPKVSERDNDHHSVVFDPEGLMGDYDLKVILGNDQTIYGRLRFLSATPNLNSCHLPEGVVLLTNGIGGMARMGVDFGRVTSKYDCVLGANLDHFVPTDRHIFVKRVRVYLDAAGFRNSNGWPLPLLPEWLVDCDPGPPARWHYVAQNQSGWRIELEIIADMLDKRNTTVLHFRRPQITPGTDRGLTEENVRLTIRVDIEDRDFHWETKRNSATEQHFCAHSHALQNGIGFLFEPAWNRILRVFMDRGEYKHQCEWSHNISHPTEGTRGQIDSGDAYSPGWFDLPIPLGSSASLILTAEADQPSVDQEFIKVRHDSNTRALERANLREEDFFGRRLTLAAQQFVVRRDDGKTVIAGYPWFKDWGRDSLICARGLLAAGMVEEVTQLLIIFGRFEEDGTLPNSIHGTNAADRNTSDAPLWYGVVCEEAAAVIGSSLYETKVDQRGRTIAQVLEEIARGYIRGTANGIRLDSSSGLIWSPAQFTWMDTNYPAGTPRQGYPIEIQVLWIKLLRQLVQLRTKAKRRKWSEIANQAAESLQKYYWLSEEGYLADLLQCVSDVHAAQAVVDNSLRSNYLLAVSFGEVQGEKAKKCVEAALRYLVVPGALRSLAPLRTSQPLEIFGHDGRRLNDPHHPYWGRYEGEEDTRRKPAYHNGTAWTWTFPIFCEALAKAWGFSVSATDAAKAYLGSMDGLIRDGCIGQIPEIVDGDFPHQQRGCDAQAWGVTEALRVWKVLQRYSA
jgi:predicted glycogen debranching enzyme